ncbi:MAG TPA: hypothetical protein EYQ04_02700, partial [Candidatus Thioglobus sp.]|nr:hypothetical protein [Candidatus Thioglobus sp.]
MKKIGSILLSVVFAFVAFNTLYAASVGINNDIAGLDIKPTLERPFPPSLIRTKNNHKATLDSFENP